MKNKQVGQRRNSLAFVRSAGKVPAQNRAVPSMKSFARHGRKGR